MDGFVEPSMPKFPSVMNAMKDVGPPTTTQPQHFGYGDQKRKTINMFDDKELTGMSTDAKKLSFGGSAQGAKSKDDVGSQMAKAMFGQTVTLSAKQKADIAEAFNAFDITGIGYMTAVDLRVALKALGFEAKKSEIKKLMDEYDIGRTGKLCFSDFMSIIQLKLAQKDTREDLIKAFKLFDKDGSGQISFQNLKAVAEELGEDANDEEIAEMIAEADLDENEILDEEEFLKVLKKASLY